jgi:beta-lactam-binding protein with PASTA domain
MLYELLTGRPPFEGDSPVTIALKQVAEDPVMPTALNPAVSPALESVVQRALQKDPANRFVDADEFIVALTAAMSGGTVAGGVGDGSTGVYPVIGPEDYVVEELERSDRRVLRTLGIALLVALVLAGIAAGAYLLLRADRVSVPDVTRNRSATAQARLVDAGFVVNAQQAKSDTVPEDRVFRQEPEPGQEAEKGSTVTIVVSAGPGDATVPSLERLTVRSARARLERRGFNARERRETSTTVPGGRVIESAPPEGSRLQKGRSVVLVVSSGPEQVNVPSVVGQSQGEAESELRAAGLDATVTEQESEDEEPGTVLAQSPSGGASVDQGSGVRLTVARRPELSEVPDVVGESRAAATAALRAAGFIARVRRERVDTADEDGRVIEQNPSGETRREPGSTIFITVGRFEEPEAQDEEETPTPTPSPSPTPTP